MDKDLFRKRWQEAEQNDPLLRHALAGKIANPHETWETACDVVDRLVGVFKRCATAEESAQFERRIDHLDLRAVAVDIVEYAMSKRDGSSSELLRALIRQIELGDFTDQHGHKLTNNVHFIAAKEAVR